jgi:hypothetical protein
VVSVPPASSESSVIRIHRYSVAKRAGEVLSALENIMTAAYAKEVLELAARWYDKEPAKLGHWCLSRAGKRPVKQAAASFVAGFGPLVQDFGEWCSRAALLDAAQTLASVEKRASVERALWPTAWHRWATSVYGRLIVTDIRPEYVPAPVGFYLWAAIMVQCLREHPEWSGSQLFLTNRLAFTRLSFGPTGLREFVKEAAAKHLLSPHLVVTGDLLDLLAARVAFGSLSPVGELKRYRMCPQCKNQFPVTSKNRVYCPNCAQSGPAVRRARFLANHPEYYQKRRRPRPRAS